MHKKSAQVPVYLALIIIIAAMIFTGCSSSSTSQAPASVTPSSTNQPAGQTQQSTNTSGQQGGPQSGQPGGQDMKAMQTKLLARVAEILGVSSDTLTTAYEAALKSVMGDRALGSGTPPQPPSDNGTPPTGGQSGQPPSGDVKGGPDMSGVYSKVAEALGLTTEKVTAAFEQARKELMPAKTN